MEAVDKSHVYFLMIESLVQIDITEKAIAWQFIELGSSFEMVTNFIVWINANCQCWWVGER